MQVQQCIRRHHSSGSACVVYCRMPPVSKVIPAGPIMIHYCVCCLDPCRLESQSFLGVFYGSARVVFVCYKCHQCCKATAPTTESCRSMLHSCANHTECICARGSSDSRSRQAEDFTGIILVHALTLIGGQCYGDIKGMQDISGCVCLELLATTSSYSSL